MARPPRDDGLVLCPLPPALTDGRLIVVNGEREHVIVDSSRPSPAERLAGQEFHDYLQRISGADLENHSGRYHGSRARVLCKWGHLQELVGRAAGGAAPAEVAGDSYETVPDKSRLFLVCGHGRSTLYSV